ncbi:MAG TPA: TIM-barrel domain-containing protein [Edaphobacter sp.]|jgi:alpha-glucosidase (family GH31 glycosyl hydrolase)|nr:TIM-barrel domain-containing protein [Edaphobacter sp.]
MRYSSASLLTGLLLLSTVLWGQSRIRITHGNDIVEVEAVTPNIVRVHVELGGRSTPRTLVMDPAFKAQGLSAILQEAENPATLTSPQMSITIKEEPTVDVGVEDSAGRVLLTFHDLLSQAKSDGITMIHNENEDLYGMTGLDRRDSGAGILRNGGAVIAAGVQGNGGAPFFFTKSYGVLVDSDGGSFEPLDQTLRFRHDSRPDIEFFVIVGRPMQTMEGLALLTGRPPMPPRWTLGFLNSQWGSTEDEWLAIAKTYQRKQIPVSAFILDFDWKAWGEDNYGEWRWNSTSGAGNPFPDKFPDGASGKFAADLLEQRIHLAGILKPRILIDRPDGTPTEASAYATAHNFWYPHESRTEDYFTHRLAGNIDFNNAAARGWYWEHLLPAFRAGMTAWWNDEADYSATTVFNNFQFLNMGRMLWDGQRVDADERVWSINRAYYLGATRYGYAEWSGDISTGFQSMAYQRTRMIAALDLGLPHWSMDTGGFSGHPTPENYARWMEFAAFVPIDRVHGGYNEKRQPWIYGPVAEAAAKRAILLRYDLMPYIYSNERLATETGIGIVRPLFWIFPDDPKTADDTRSWMFGDALLVSPIVAHGETTHTFYLPAGRWFDYANGRCVSGGRELQIPADSIHWQDIPIYVRNGSIVATQPSQPNNDVDRKVPLVLDVFASAARTAEFTVYDDDGHTYAYEHGAYFRQRIAAVQHGNVTTVTLASADGSYASTIPSYLFRIHRGAVSVRSGRRDLYRFPSMSAFQDSSKTGWVSTQDRFGPVTLVRTSISQAGSVITALAPGHSRTANVRP